MSTSAARYRRPAQDSPADLNANASSKSVDPVAGEKAELKAAVQEQAVKTSNSLSVVDVLRILGGVVLLSAGLSYLTTSGKSMTWGYNAWWTRAREWKTLLVHTNPQLALYLMQPLTLSFPQQPEVSLTDTELLAFDGTDPAKPIYLALNGTIYDVSASPSTYGPGGSYHFFAGHDAARAFLTGCFAEDAVPDLRGVEQMFIPVDPEQKASASPEDVEKAKHRKPLSSAERKNRHAQELRSARKQVREGLENWHTLFRGDKGKPYKRVGAVKREAGWLEKMPVRGLCEQAEKGRPARKYE